MCKELQTGFKSSKYYFAVDSIKLKYINKTYPIEIEWENKPSECQNKNLTFNCRGKKGIILVQTLRHLSIML